MVKLFRPVLVVLVIGICLAWFASDSFAATFTVTKTADTNDGTCDADCSIREAIAATNANPGADTVEFNIPTSDPGYINPDGSRDSTSEIAGTYSDTPNGYFSILTLLGVLSVSDTDGLFINGYSQANSQRNTSVFGSELITTITIQLNTGANVFTLGGGNNRFSGINFVGRQLDVTGNSNWIEGNYFGTDPSGEYSVGNGNVYLHGGSGSNIIGTKLDSLFPAEHMNLFGGSTSGWSGNLGIEGSNYNIVSGNYLGTDKSGRRCSPGATLNYYASVIGTGATGNIFGSNLDGYNDDLEANIIGCTNNNYRAYIRVLGGAQSNYVQGNFIGLSPNGDLLGMLYDSNRAAVSFAWGEAHNTVVANNVIGNASFGIICLASCTGTFSNNVIANNIKYKSISLGVTANSNYPTPNDPGDKDTGPNDLMNYPEIRHANHLGDGRYAIGGIIDGNLSEAPFTIELCRSSNHPSGHGGCSQTLATTTTTGTDWEVFITTDINDPAGLQLSALATNSRGSTSEFSRTVTAKAATPLSLPLPTSPDLTPSTGASITKDSVVAVAQSQTFNYDAYLSTITTTQTAPLRLPGTLFFQASPIHEIWWRAYANDAKILDSEVNTGYIIALKYQPESLDPNLNQRHLRLAYRPDNTASWKVLYNSVHDPHNHTVATVTKTGGEYMLVSRW